VCSSYGVRTDPFTIENMPSIVVAAFLVYCQARVNKQPAARRVKPADMLHALANLAACDRPPGNQCDKVREQSLCSVGGDVK